MTRHFCISVRGNLRYSLHQLEEMWKDSITTDDGRVLKTGHEIREWWFDQLALGREVIPACDSKDCPNFDYRKHGCPGHEDEP